MVPCLKEEKLSSVFVSYKRMADLGSSARVQAVQRSISRKGWESPWGYMYITTSLNPMSKTLMYSRLEVIKGICLPLILGTATGMMYVSCICLDNGLAATRYRLIHSVMNLMRGREVIKGKFQPINESM